MKLVDFFGEGHPTEQVGDPLLNGQVGATVDGQVVGHGMGKGGAAEQDGAKAMNIKGDPLVPADL
jgi:hypothetical protein